MGFFFWMNELFPILSESHLSWDADLVAVEVVGLLAVFAVFVDAVSIRETAYIRAAHALRQDWKFYVCYGLLYISH